MARSVDFRRGQAVAIGLRDQQQPVGRRLGERCQHRLLAAALDPLDRDFVEPVESGFERAQRLLHRLGEAAADRHRLADRLHRRRQQRRRAGKFLEREARHLGDDVVDRRLEAGRGDSGDLVVELVERVADRELGGDLGDRESGRLRRQRRGTRDARVHLDNDQPPIGRVDRELHVRPAGIDADLAQHRDRGVAHQLVFLIGQGQRRRDRHRIAGMHAHRVDVLDRADDDAVVVAVAHDFELVLLPAEHRLLDQHFVRRRSAKPAADDLLEFLGIVGDAAAGAAQREGWADDRRQPGHVERL